MACLKVHYWPAFVTLWIVVTFIISYAIAVATKKVYPFFPYISETGAIVPASCFFGQLLNIAAVLTGIALYIRYKQVDLAIKTNVPDINRKWNEICFWLGLIIALGISMVANFQADVTGPVIILIIHIIGALFAFGIGGIYMIIQTKITYDLKSFYDTYPKYAVSRGMQHLRLFLTFCYFVCFVFIFAFAFIGGSKFDGKHSIWWTSEYGGYAFHLVSTISEWILVLIFLIYMLSVTREFKAVTLNGISIKREEGYC